MSTHLLTARGRVVVSLVMTLAATGLASCDNVGAHASATAIPVSREILRMDENAARYSNVYDAIAHLRPEYLTVRDQGSIQMVPVAYLNGVRLADPDLLRLVPVSWALEIRWVRPNQTSILYGHSHHIGGGIFVRTK
jgi:hypothetical protein